MFRASPDSSRIDLFSNIEQFLRERDQVKLNDPNTWHNVFLDQVTKRIDEERFAELFDEENGRPNAPIRLLVAMLILKEGFGWSDEQLFEAIHFNLLVRRALGLLNLTDEVPVESTYYLFKQRLYRYQVETGVNLLQEVFQELTGDQAKRLGVVGEKLRMDSTLLDSNLATCTRLQLIIGCLQEFWKGLTDEQKARLNEADRALLDRLCAKRPSQIIYGLDETTKKTWLEDFGNLLLRLHQTYSAQNSPRYELIERLLLEQYRIEGEGEEQGRYDYERTDDGVVVADRESGETQLAEEYKPGRYRFRVDGKWRYITDKDLDTAECRRRTEDLPRELFNRRCNVEATIFQLCYHTNKKKLKYRGKFRVQLWAVCRAAWINMRRIASYQAEQAEAIA